MDQGGGADSGVGEVCIMNECRPNSYVCVCVSLCRKYTYVSVGYADLRTAIDSACVDHLGLKLICIDR